LDCFCAAVAHTSIFDVFAPLYDFECNKAAKALVCAIDESGHDGLRERLLRQVAGSMFPHRSCCAL
jgi:hypothetical protein